MTNTPVLTSVNFERAMESVSTDDISWTVLQYDLKTAIDVLHMPCLVKLADDKLFGGLTDESAHQYGVRAGSMLKLETSLTVQYVQARVLPLGCVDWFIQSKGEHFVAERERFVGREILIPLEYEGRLMIREENPSREYYNIREVVQDFPRFMRVERDVVCAIPGCPVPQVATAGTILELDRVTTNKVTIRRRRDNFLVCFDRENSRELAFGLNTPGHFTSIVDTNTYVLKEFVDRVSLPKTIEFQYTNPRHVVSAVDKEAKDVHLIFGGPLEILGLKSSKDMVGIMQYENNGAVVNELFVFPNDDDLLEAAMVYIPTHCLDESCDFVVDELVLDSANCDILNNYLYLRYLDTDGVVVVKNAFPFFEPDCKEGELEDVPPIPPKDSVDRAPTKPTLRYSRSTPFVRIPSDSLLDDDDATFRKKRFHSDGDVDDADDFLDSGFNYENNKDRRQTRREPSGIRRYMSQISQRMKRTASQLLFGRDSDTSVTSTSTESQFSLVPESCINQHKSRVTADEILRSGFICHINSDAEQDKPGFTARLHGETDYCGSVLSNADSSRSYLKQINRIDYDEPIYTFIDWSSKKCTPDGINHYLLCPVCRECRRELLCNDRREDSV